VLGVNLKPFPEYDQYYSIENVRNMIMPMSETLQAGAEDQHLNVGDILNYIPGYWAWGWKNLRFVYPARLDGG